MTAHEAGADRGAAGARGTAADAPRTAADPRRTAADAGGADADDREADAGGYGEAPPPTVLADRVACLWWVTASPGDGAPLGHAVLPDGAVDLVWHTERLTIAGPDTRARLASTGPGTAIGVRLRPGAATTFGDSAAALRDLQPSAEELWGAEGRRLAERVAGASDPRSRLEHLVAAVTVRVAEAPPTDPQVDGAVEALLAQGPGPAGDGPRGTSGIAGIAADAGLSERQLRRRFHEHVGYGPKTLDRVLRLQRFLTLAIATDESLAGLAALAGYADQAHLARETRALAGTTATDLVATRRPRTRAPAGATALVAADRSEARGVSETSKTST